MNPFRHTAPTVAAPDVTTPRVLQVVLSLNPGGTERLVVELVRRLHADIPMAVCCLDEEGSWGRELRESGVSVVALGRNSGFHPSLGRGIARLARQHRADVVHCHHYSPFVYGCLSRLWAPYVSVLFTEHGRLSDARPSRKRRVANAWFSRVPSAVFAVSEDLKRHIVAEGFSDRAVRVIHNGIDMSLTHDAATRTRVRAQIGADDAAVVVGTVARLDPVKDLGTLIAALAKLDGEPTIQLVIVGDGSERPALTTMVERNGLSGRVWFAGHREDARDWLQGCDIYANSSIGEGISLTILEAMAARLPIVATRVGGTAGGRDRRHGILGASPRRRCYGGGDSTTGCRRRAPQPHGSGRAKTSGAVVHAGPDDCRLPFRVSRGGLTCAESPASLRSAVCCRLSPQAPSPR